MLKSSRVAIAAGLLALAGCSPKEPTPRHPDGAVVETFVESRTIMQRGVKTVGGGVGKNLPPRLARETYRISCLTEHNGNSAKRRSQQVLKHIQANEPQIRDQIIGEGYRRSFTSSRITKATYAATGCTTKISFEAITTDTSRIIKFLIDNNLLGQLAQMSRR